MVALIEASVYAGRGVRNQAAAYLCTDWRDVVTYRLEQALLISVLLTDLPKYVYH